MSSQTSMGKVFFALCNSVDTPVSLGLWLRFKHSPSELLSVKLRPEHYTDPATFSKDYMLISLVRKYKGLQTGVETDLVALQKFHASEEQCSSTNKRIRESGHSFNERVEGIIHSAKRKIARILGPFSYKKVLHQCEWTIGATLELPRRKAFVDTKLTQLPITVTRRALPHLVREIEHDPAWFFALTGIYPSGAFCILRDSFEVVKGNRITTVPKDSSTDRVIAIEPRGNIFLQKGVGNYIRGRLKKYGIDLSKQETNQFWAQCALDLGLSTIDLSSASDTIAKELVFLLLPVDWANHLDEVRSPFGEVSNQSFIKYEKFSSMGNGFTFELESLIFFALCEAAQEMAGKVDWMLTSVYGDDIIIPEAYYDEVAEMLDWFGFSVNHAKSYRSGQFFESCGKHYYSGRDVTPIYQKELLDEIEGMRLGNRLQRWSLRNDAFPLIREAWQILRSTYVATWNCQLPLDAEGDDGWIMLRFKPEAVSKNHGYQCRVVRFMKKGLPFDDKAMLAYALRKLSWRSLSKLIDPWRHASPSISDLLSDRLGYLSVDIGEEQLEFEVESARFTFARRWVHTNVGVRGKS